MGNTDANAEFLAGNVWGPGIQKPPAQAGIQWKGTDVCFDFVCPCGGDGHFDGYFASVIRCVACGQEYEMPVVLYPRAIEARNPSCAVEPELD